MKRWFMSYVHWQKGAEPRHRFGCLTVEDGEHPIAKVKRWNEVYNERVTVLLSFHEISADVPRINQEA